MSKPFKDVIRDRGIKGEEGVRRSQERTGIASNALEEKAFGDTESLGLSLGCCENPL